MSRKAYIDNIDVNVAIDEYFKKLEINPKEESIKVRDSLNRVTSKAVYAKLSSPSYNSAAMDGIAVISDHTTGATESEPKTLKLNSDFIYINTGNPVKDPFDAVIMIEDCIIIDEETIEILSPAYPYQHIRQIGEDIVATEMILPSKHKIRPVDIGALISGGIDEIYVYEKPKVALVPTGSEIVENVNEVVEGKIIDSNSYVFENVILELGGIPNKMPIVKDDYESIKEMVSKAVEENDLVLVNAGSSAGTMDYTVDVIEEIGEVVVHGVAMKPGKPTILGIVKGKPVVGIPGYPVSSYLVFDVFVKPVILKFLGLEDVKDEIVKATLTKRVVSSLKNEEIIRVTLGFVDDKLIATPLQSGAGVIMSLVKADGLCVIPRNVEGYDASDEVDVKLLKPLYQIKESLVSIGSHDICMDIISDMMKLKSTHVGSMGGILSLKRKECHLAPIHLLDVETGEYNISYVKKYFNGEKMALIKGLKRTQGFIVEKGNPLNIQSVKDLIRDDVVFANRQRGSGTRVLLDYELAKNNVNPEKIKGYQREFSTHMAVAAAVKNRSANVGLGVYSASKALDLDFYPLKPEEYDFLTYAKNLELNKIKEFIEILRSEEFKDRVEALGGYGFDNIGEIIIIE
ncbi:molybdopterin biosynthesis protein [Soehngenia saccharolytica]|nr:molybdopterin biosynthesis protein [Soehngenia saccharolytica]